MKFDKNTQMVYFLVFTTTMATGGKCHESVTVDLLSDSSGGLSEC